MLTLTRRVGQTLKIGDAIEVSFLGLTHRGDLRIGITAPKDVPIWREEIVMREGDLPSHAADAGKKEAAARCSG